MNVAPYVGAWIETISLPCIDASGGVAPYVGAWIETLMVDQLRNGGSSRTLCGCVD